MQRAILSLFIAICCPALAQQKAPLPYTEQLAAFHAQAEQMSQALYAANAAMESAHDEATANAAAPLVQAVHRQHALMAATTQSLEQAGATVTELFSKGKLRLSLRHLPMGRYQELKDELLMRGCHGSVRLYLALTHRTTEFSEEQINAPLSEADAATLRAVADVFELLRLNTNQKKWESVENFDTELLALIDKAQPGIDALKQSPAALMQFDAMVITARPHLQLLYERAFYEYGDLEERLMRRPDNFFANLYSEYYRRTYFDRRASHTNHPDIRKLEANRWDAVAPALTEFRKKYDLGKGDGRTPETAFSFPPHINRSNYVDFLNEFSQNIFGEDALFVQAPKIQNRNKFGKPVVYALAYGGRLQGKYLRKIHLIYCYFYLPQ